MDQEQPRFPRIHSLKLQGYRPFGDFTTRLSELEVVVGANGAGKSSLLEFLKFLRNAVHQDIPPEIVEGSAGQQIFHRPGPDRFRWSIEIELLQPRHFTPPGEATDWFPRIILYQGEVLGPVGRVRVLWEQVLPPHDKVFMRVQDGEGFAQDPETGNLRQELYLRRPNQLALSVMTNPSLTTLYYLREFIANWRFYSAFNINNVRIRKPVPVEQEPVLQEDGSNLSAVLFNLMTEHPVVFDALKTCLRSAVPGFRNLTVKARGGPGEVIAFWQEQGVDD